MSIVGHTKGARAATLVVNANPAHILPEHPYTELQRRRRQAAEDRAEYANAGWRNERCFLALWAWRERQVVLSQLGIPLDAVRFGPDR